MAFDFDTLSAFVDDELDGETRARVEAALADDPQLMHRVSELRALKADVAAMQGDLSQLDVTAVKRLSVLPFGAAIAAALAAIVISGVLAVAWLDPSGSTEARLVSQLVAIHDDSVSSVPAPALIQASVPEARLFRRAGLSLTLDEVRKLPGDLVMRHRVYTGSKGCRVSVFALPAKARDAASLIAAEPDLLAAYWETETGLSIVIARAMDTARFDSIAVALKHIGDPGNRPMIANIDIPRTVCAS